MKKVFVTFLMVFSFYPCMHLVAQISDGVKYENVMAVYMYNFTKFIEWTNNDPDYFFISVLGKNKVVVPLNKIAQTEKVNGKKIIVDEIKDITQLKKCNMLFISTDDDNTLTTALKRTVDKNILTISNKKEFARQGGMIGFVVKDEKVKIEINMNTINKAKLKINAKLLEIAQIVSDEE